MRALIWDFGGPVLLTPFELRAAAERRLGLAPGTFAWPGPFDPAADVDWRAMQAGEFTEREYWHHRADEYAAISGGPGGAAGLKPLFEELFQGSVEELTRPGAWDLTREVKAAGKLVAVLTNDMHAFHDAEWIERMTFLRELDVLVDGSLEGLLKPDPRIFQLALDRLEVPAEEAVFVDDQPGNCAAAIALGMYAVHFDVTKPDDTYLTVRQLLGSSAG
jgi:putative hydrolase of the HAD superfamily